MGKMVSNTAPEIRIIVCTVSVNITDFSPPITVPIKATNVLDAGPYRFSRN